MLTPCQRFAAGLIMVLTSLLVAPESFAAATAPSVVCDDPSSPQSCVLSTSIPGSPGGDTAATNAAAEGGVGIKFNDGSGSAADYNSQTGTNSAAGGSDGGSGGGAVKPVPSTECDWTPLSPAPGADDLRWGGADPATNTIIQNNCNGPTRYSVIPNGANAAAIGGVPAAAAPAPPDPAVLAQQAIGELRIPKPVINLGPDSN